MDGELMSSGLGFAAGASHTMTAAIDVAAIA